MTAALATAALLATSCDRPTSRVGEACAASDPRPDIVLISIDSLRPDHLGAYGYAPPTSPTIDRLAAEGVVFENAVSTTSWTLPAHAAMFTGLYDSAHGALDIDDRLAAGHTTLAESLRDAGYRTAGFFGGPFLHPTFGLDQGFEVYRSAMTVVGDDAPDEAIRGYADYASHRDVTGPRTVERFRRWLETADPCPTFVFLHLWDVHYDYIPPERYVRLFDPDYEGEIDGVDFIRNEAISAGMAPRDLEHVVALYDGEIRFTDDTIRQLLEDFERARGLDDAIVVVTSDHGDEFFEHQRKGHQKTLFEEVVRVPLIVRWPGRAEAGLRVADQVRLIDLMPTLLEAAGVEEPPRVQGRDIAPLLSGGSLPPQPALLELVCLGRDQRAWRSNERKLILDRSAGLGWLFDLVSDPREQHALQPGTPEFDARIAGLKARLDAELAAASAWGEAIGDREGAEVDADMLERLRALGYVE